MNKGTLHQLKNVLNRSLPASKVKLNYRAVHDFFGIVLDAHITAAAMEHLGMECTSDKPTRNCFAGSIDAASDGEKKKFLSSVVSSLVEKFFDCTPTSSPWTCALSATELQQPATANAETKKERDDRVVNYARTLVGLGLTARNFEDASHEGDGARLLRCWKVFMLHFKADGRTKYALEAFNLIASVNGFLSPRKAHQLMWNRTCNTKGGAGNNIPLDLHNEHLNRVFKEDINTFQSNLTSNSVARSSQAIGPLSDLLSTLDKNLHVKTPSGKHIDPSVTKDFQLVLETLTQEQVFSPVEERKHSSFPNMTCNPLESLAKKASSLHTWMVNRRKALYVDAQLLKQKY